MIFTIFVQMWVLIIPIWYKFQNTTRSGVSNLETKSCPQLNNPQDP